MGLLLKKDKKTVDAPVNKGNNCANTENELNLQTEDDVNEENIIDNEANIIAEYDLKFKESQDRFIRLQADFENFRKRVAKEREDIYLFSLEELMTQLISIIDDFERALDSFKAGDLDEKYVEGLEMVFNNFLGVLTKNGLSEIEAKNCIFDPNYHHAVMQEETDDDDNVVKEIFQKGYMLNTKVIRPCMVKVAVKN